MSQLKRAAIVGEHKRRVRKVAAPEWNGAADGYVYVRELWAAEALAIRETKGDDLSTLVDICILAICDKEGRRLLGDEDRAALRNGPLAPLERCGDVVLDLCGLSEKAERQSKKASARPRGSSRMN